MKTATRKTLSTVPIVRASRQTRQRRPSQQSIQTLEFIHRFRHVTTRHIQLCLGHTNITTSFKQLTYLSDQCLVARQYGPGDRAVNRAASYFLTPEGLSVLQAHRPNGKYRRIRSVEADAAMGMRSRERYRTLADAYTHFKQHYNGYFEFFSAFDIAGLDYMPDEVPDGYVRVTLPDCAVQHYFIEVYGWNRSTQLQQRRIHSYLQFAESERWQTITNQQSPSLFIVAGSTVSQKRLNAQLPPALQQSLANDFSIFTTIATKLDSHESAIWRHIQPSA